MRKIFTPFLLILLSFLTFTLPSTAQLNEYFSIRSTWSGATTTVTFNGNPQTDIEYSTDKVNWTKITQTTNIPTYNKTYFRGNNPNGFSKSATDYVSFLAGGSSQNYYLEGNIMSLVNGSTFATNYSTIPADYCFYSLFTDKAGASSNYHPVYWYAGDLLLPADNLTRYCYASMFERTYIKTAPQLPAQHLAEYCYYKMYYTCISLDMRTSYPATPIEYILPAEELVPHCYEHMFGVYNNNPTMYQYITIMATSLQDRRGDDIQNCLKEMFYFGVNTNGGSKNTYYYIQMFFRDWGDVSKTTCPTYDWFSGNYNCSRNYFFYDTNLSWTLSNVACGKSGVKSQFPYGAYSCETNNCTSFWVPEDYSYLTFDCKTNGGTWEADDDYDTDLRRVVRTGYTAKTVPAAPHKLGCSFLGWYTAPDGGTQVSEATIKTQTTAQTYYAHFMPNDVDFTVTIANGEHGHVVVTKTNADPNVEYTSTSSVHNMSELTITAVPDAGYRFKNWTGEAATIKAAEDAGNTYYLVDDITVGAEFEADECTVTILTPTEYGSLAASDGTNNYASGNTYTFNRQNDKDKVLTFTATPDHYRLFTGFTGTELNNVTSAPYVYDQAVTGTYTINASTPDEVTVGATFVKPQYTVTGTKTGRGNGSVVLTADGYPEQTGSGTYDIDAVVTLTATPANAMFKFVRWTDNDSDNPVRTYTVLGDATFEAEFDLDGDLWSAPATVDVYASGVTRTCASTITTSNYRILYNLDPVVGDDGITYTPVDMGAGVAWADRNVGATDPTKAGSYFYWGGITPVTSVSNTTYNTNVANEATLPLEKDAARQVMGAQWRMPTGTEMSNLCNTTYTVATTIASYNYQRTNKYYPDDKIFIPASGRYQTTGSSAMTNQKTTSYLYSSTRANSSAASSKIGHFYNNAYYTTATNTAQYAYCWYAEPVRAVYVPKFETCTLKVIVYWASTLKWTYNYICEVGQTVTINQHPNYSGYKFSAWRESTYSGAELSTDNSYTVTLTGDQTIAAHYISATTYLLTTKTSPLKGGTVDGGGYYPTGTSVTLTATPNANYRFVRWSDGNTDNPRTYTTTNAAVTLTAEFEGYVTGVTSADANVDVFAYIANTGCYKILYDLPSEVTGDDGKTYRPVDMGGGVVWADRNVGASSPTDPGSYFYWGGTVPTTKPNTTAGNYYEGVHSMLLTTNYTVATPQYALPQDADAAHVIMGDRWRMANYAEIYYLAAPTGATETGSATAGMTYVNKLDNDKQLFIPNSGYYKTANSTTPTANHAVFWGSTLGSYNANATSSCPAVFYAGTASSGTTTYYMWHSMPVRAVYVPPFETCTLKVTVTGLNQVGNGTSSYTYYYICEVGQRVRITAQPHSVGSTGFTYAFTQWTDDDNSSAVVGTNPTIDFVIAGNTNYTATFASTTSNFSTIHALPQPRSAGYVYGVGRYKNGVTTQLHAVPEEGWTFVRWEDNNSTDPYREITVNGNASYNAVFTRAGETAASEHKYVNVWHEATTTTTETLYDGSPLETCTLTVKTYQANSVKATYNYVCEKGQKVTVSAFTNTSSYSLLHWTNTNYDIMSYDPTVELEVNRDMTLYATFYTTRVTTRTLTLVSSPLEGAIFDGAVKTTQLGVYEDGQVTKLICHPKPHYRFLYWDDDHNLTDTIRYVTVNADRTYTAVLEIDYDLASVTSADAFAQVYYGGTYQGTYLRYDLPGYDENGYRPVDVGVGVAWANKNIGAADSTKAGDYFVWGLTTPATTVNSNGSAGTYYAGVTSMTTTAGYSTVPQNTLPAEADAATQIMGERWRMPNCTEIYNLQGVIGSGSTEEGQASAGYRYTNVENTSQFIYIPAAGCMKTSGSGTVTTGTTQFWGSTASTISGASSRPSYYLSGSYSAGSTYYYAWSAMPVRAVYVPPFETCSVKVVTNSKTYIYMCEVGQRITITAFYGAATASNQSYRVDKWVDQNNVTVCTDQTYSFIALSDVTLTVTYTSSYTTKRTLTFNVSPASSGTVNNLASFVGQYNDGAKVRIPVKAAANYRFSHWADDVNNTDPDRIFTATANTTYTAVFEPDPAQAAEATIAQAATADTTKILYPLPVLYKNSMFYTPVDMGTGTAWYDYNVGVTNPTSPNGYYFLWGATANKTSTYRTTTYTSGAVTNTTEGGDFPYNTTYDAALYQMGTGWRVPSKAQWDALVDNCSTGTANTFVNPGDASKTITLPQAGSYAPNTTSNYSTLSTGLAAYWSSTLAHKDATAQNSQPYCYFNGNVTYGADIPISGRQGYVSYGMPIRAVYQPTFTPCTLTVRYTNDEEVTRTNTYLCQPGQPVRVEAIADDGYIFSEWTEDHVADAVRTIFMSGDLTLTATFAKKSENSAIINFMTEDGLTKLSWVEVEKGEVPEYDGEEPAKVSTDEFDYTFAGWTDMEDNFYAKNGSLPAATADMDYFATFTPVRRSYLITFRNADGSTLQATKVEYGQTPSYNTTPTQAATAQYTYTFNGWDSEVVAVTGEAIYTATYSNTLNSYTVTFKDAAGNTIQSGTLDYGVVPAFTGDIPVKESADPDYVWNFTGWTDGNETFTALPSVTGTTVYTATYAYELNYLTVTNTHASQKLTVMLKRGSYAPANVTLNYRVISANGSVGAWQTLTTTNSNTSVTFGDITAGSRMQFYGDNSTSGFAQSTMYYWTMYFSGSGNAVLSGDLMSVFSGTETTINHTQTLPSYAFYNFFYNTNSKNTRIISSRDLKLSATNLGQYCYGYMFAYCSNMTDAPQLLAETLASDCYYGMFSYCSSLTDAPLLPATTLANNCYNYMFSYCTSLTTAPQLSVTTLTDGCYQSMFKGCTSLVNVQSELPSNDLPQNCYYEMFSGCTALTTAPEIMAGENATVGQSACYNMFTSCTSLTKAPSVLRPRTLNANQAYYNMFLNCTSLQRGPDVQATTVTGSNALFGLYQNASSLTHIRVHFPAWGAMSFCNQWSVSLPYSGDFYCPPELDRDFSNSSWNHIPYSPEHPWIVYSYDVTFIPVGGKWADNTSAEKQFTWRTDKSDIDNFIAAQVDGDNNSLIQGWFLNAACTEATTEEAVRADLAVQRTAETKKVYVRLSGTNPTLLWDFNGGTTTSTEAEYTFGVMNAGDPITAPADPTRFGYTFMGWSSAQPADNTPVTVATTMPATDLIYTAIWQVLPTYLITANTGSMGAATLTADHYDDAEGSGSYIAGTQVTISVTPYFGYTFTGWSDSNTQNPRTITVGSTAATYTAQFDAMDEIDITMTEGTLDFPTYAKNSFAIIGENDQVEVRLHFGAAISTGNHLANLSTNLANSYIQPAGESKRQIASATVANVTYEGELFRAAHLVAKVTDTDGRKYNIDIYTNYCINYATFQENYRYNSNYNAGYTESSWMNGRSFEYGEDNHINYIGIPSLVHTNVLRFFTGTSSPYDYCHIWLQFNPLTTGEGKIPTGVYPINSTGAPGTVYIGSIPQNYQYQTARQTSTPAYYTNTGSWIYHDFTSGQYEIRYTDNWTLRGGYVEVVNVDEKYWVHVHAYTDGYKTNGEQPNTVIDFTAGGDGNAYYTVSDLTIAAQTTGGESLAGAVTAAVVGASNWTDVSLGQGTHSLFSGNTLDLTAELDGYIFDHWELNGTPVAGEDYTYSYTVGATDAQIVAVFTLDNSPRYTITFENENGTQLQQLTVIENHTPVYTGATPTKAGWQFNGWTPAIVAATADATYTATYLPLFTLTTVTGGQGTVTLTAGGYEPAEGTGIYAQGTAVTMNVTAGAGASFAGWDDDNDGTVDNTQNPRTVTLTADKTYNVVFGLESSDQALNIYQAAAADTTKILYNLDAKTGLDGNTYIPVDLGYGVAWADRNVGATGTNVIGSYFCWGDPVASNTFNSSTHIDANGFSTGDKLSNSQDAAYVNMGTCWHMPDRNELLALKANTDLSNNNTFTNRTDNTKSIVFLAGGYKGQSHYDPDYQYYWSREYAMYGYNSKTKSNERTCFAFVRCTDNQYYASNYDKDDYYGNEYYLGMPVRAIYEPQYTTHTLTINVNNESYTYICQEGQKVTVTAVPEEGYAFSEWSEDHSSVNPRTFTVNDDMEYTATFTEAMTYHTVTVTAAPAGYGIVNVSAVTNVPHGTNITVNGSQATIYNTTVTATPAANDAQYTYTFTGWTNAPATVNSDLTVTANFTRTTRTYVVTIAEVENGTVVVKNGDNVVANGSEVPYGTTLTVVATPAENYEFSAWTSGTPALDGNGQFTLTGSVTIGATFTALPEEPEEPETDKLSVTLNEVIFVYGEVPNQQVIETAVMSVTDGTNTYTYDENEEDNTFEFPVGTELTFSLAPTDPLYTYGEWQDEDENILSTGLEWNIILTEDMDVYAWCGIDNLVWEDKAPAGYADYDAYYTYMMTTYAGKPIHRLSLNRTFKANAWGTICLPVVKMNIEQSAIGDMLYSLHKAYTQNNRSVVVIDFAVSPVVEPGMPYLIISPSEVKNPYFEYVMLDPSAEAQSVHDDLGGDVDFIGVLKTPVHLEPGDRGVRYLSSNKLYYPNSKGSGATITADRAYFEIRNFSPAAAPRVIVTVDGETVLEDAEELQADTSAGISKYIENGILIIERAGQRYDGTGRRIATAPAE